jgi:DNA-binding beta-propeller fold protein YncE
MKPRPATNGRAISPVPPLLIGITFCFLGCGGGGQSQPPKLLPDFSITAPGTSSVAQGGSTRATIGIQPINGFTGQVIITVGALPIGVEASTTTFSLSPGGQQDVTFSADSEASVGTTTMTISAESGALSHHNSISLTVTKTESSGALSLRTNFLRTDAQWDIAYLNFAPQPWIVYDSATRRFFVSNTSVSRIDVIDAQSESVVAEIPVPRPWTGDISPDHKSFYMGTLIGDVYEIDPLALNVRKRFVSSGIGAKGFAAYGARVMADGRLALLGSQAGVFLGGLPAIDGFKDLLIWNPSDNSSADYALDFNGRMVDHISGFTLTADRTKIILDANGASDVGVSLFDPKSGIEKFVLAPGIGTGFPVLTPADGKTLLVSFGTGLTVYDANTLTQTDQFVVGDGQEGYSYILSPDGNTLFAVSRISSNAYAIDWRNHSEIGTLEDFSVMDVVNGITPMTADETGLIIGTIGHGVALVDGAFYLKTPTKSLMSICCYPLEPSYGPNAGGTQVQEIGLADGASFSTVLFGHVPATAFSTTTNTWSAVSPPGQPGPVNVILGGTDGSIQMFPEFFSYGPTIVELTTTAATADGGGTGRIYGYGFGDPSGDADSSLGVTIGGRAVKNLNYSRYGYSPAPGIYPFPLEMIDFTLPSGTPDSASGIVVTTTAGTTNPSADLAYYPKPELYPLPGASLAQGIYDARRDLYYFADQTQIRVFSKTSKMWLPSVSLAGAGRLWSLALSPDGGKLAVSDAGSNLIFVLNANNLTLTRSYPVNADPTSRAGAVAITDSGFVYFIGSGINALHKLDTASGTVTDIGTLMLWNPYAKMLGSNDNRKIFFNLAGGPLVLDTTTGTTTTNDSLANEGDLELALSGDQSWLTAADYVMDTNLNAESFLTLTERQAWNETAVYGEKLNADGSLLFRPLVDALDVMDGKRAILITRIALPMQLSPVYDALVSDGKDNVFVCITGQNADGIAILDLSSIQSPTPSSVFQAHPDSISSSTSSLRAVDCGNTNRSSQSCEPHASALSGPWGPQIPHATESVRVAPQQARRF